MSKIKFVEKGILYTVFGLFSLFVSFGLSEPFNLIFEEDFGNPADQLWIIFTYYATLFLGIGLLVMALACLYRILKKA